MSAVVTRIPLEDAREYADALLRLLGPVCERIEIGGSVRRGRETVKDIEVVAIPMMAPTHDMFGNQTGEVDCLHQYVSDLTGYGTFEKRLDINGVQRFGRRTKLLRYQGINVDLFTAQPDNWGLIFMLRTGPAEFNMRMVKKTYQGGMLPYSFRVGKVSEKGDHPSHLWEGNTIIPTPEEIDVFNAIGVNWIAPEDRR